MVKLYDRNGKQIKPSEWHERFIENYRVLKQDFVNECEVYTLWIGIDSCLFLHERHPLFETWVIPKAISNNEKEELRKLRRRYSIEQEAFLGHEEVVMQVRDFFSDLKFPCKLSTKPMED